MFAWLSRVLMLTALGLAGWGAWNLLVKPMSDPPLRVVWPGPDLGEVAVGAHELVVRVTNPAGQSRRIIGMMKTCGSNSCISPRHYEPVVIPPGGTVSFLCLLEIRQPMPFEVPMVLYLEDNGAREVKQTLRGVAIAPKGRIDDRDPKSKS
jgi:hypothetical protein